MSNLHIFSDNTSFVDSAADFIMDAAIKAIAERDRFTIALSGGGTPRPIYTRLASAGYRERIDWSKVHIFFGDDRCVPPDDARSNYRMAREALLDHVALPTENMHRMRGEDDPTLEALRYEQDLARFYRTTAIPAFDLILLGLGENGHTASLFPGTAALREKKRWVAAQYVEVMTTWRVTFTAPLINAARQVAFLVEGAGKAQMLWNVLEGPYQPDVWPAQLIQPASGKLHWLVDAAAAAKVTTARSLR
jgi:6-phosphogluconolactonase